MKKKMNLLTILILFLFIGINFVDADELTCIYGRGNITYKFQQSNGKNYLFLSDTKEVNWKEFAGKFDITIHKDGSAYKELSLKECLPFLGIMSTDAISYYVKIVDDEYLLGGTNYSVFPLIEKQDNNKPTDSTENKPTDSTDNKPTYSNDDNIFYYQFNGIYQEEISKKTNDWFAECSYNFLDNYIFKSSMKLYFNKDKYILINENSACLVSYLEFSVDELNEYFKQVVYQCPPRLFVTANTTNPESSDYTKDLRCDIFLKVKGTFFEAVNVKNIVNVLRPEPEPEPEPIDDCKSLFGDDLVKIINKVMDWVKIIVPILLIGLGIFDFTKAIFAADEEKMKKAGKTFFNRIIAAVLVFIAPIFVNLILNLANEVWSEIKADTCISQTK